MTADCRTSICGSSDRMEGVDETEKDEGNCRNSKEERHKVRRVL